jgi:hypothetical protein
MIKINPGSKYFPLYEYLRLCEKVPLVLTFEKIERLIEKSLPKSAWRSRAFWSNRVSGGLQAKAWMEAGYHVIDVSFENKAVTFGKPSIQYEVRREGDTILWTGSMVYALRLHLGISQAELADRLGVRQQTISEWENQSYRPTRSRSKHLNMVAEKVGFDFTMSDQPSEKQNNT